MCVLTILTYSEQQRHHPLRQPCDFHVIRETVQPDSVRFQSFNFISQNVLIRYKDFNHSNYSLVSPSIPTHSPCAQILRPAHGFFTQIALQ